jgi:uncharacterized membrane protein
MAAYIQVTDKYGDELIKIGSIYQQLMGPETGLDGDLGDRADVELIIKNTGDRTALRTTAYRSADPNARLSIRTASSDYTQGDLVIGDINPGETRTIYLKVEVKSNTEKEDAFPRLHFKYKTRE